MFRPAPAPYAGKRTEADLRRLAASAARLRNAAMWRELLRLADLRREDWAGRMERGRQRYEAAREEDRMFRIEAASARRAARQWADEHRATVSAPATPQPDQ